MLTQSVLQCVVVHCSVLQCVAVCCSALRRPSMKEQRRDNPHVTLCRHAARSCPQMSTISRQRSHVSLQKSPISPQKNISLHGKLPCISAKELYICAKETWEETRQRDTASAISLALYIRSPISLHTSTISRPKSSISLQKSIERRRTGSAILCTRDLRIRPNT